MWQEVVFSRWLRLRRTALDLTQWDLAERVGCSREAIQKIEAGTPCVLRINDIVS